MKPWHEYRVELQVTTLIGHIERFHGNWEKNKRLNPAAVDSLIQTTIVTSSGASTRIEGALLSDEEIENLLEKGFRVTGISSRSEREVAGYIKSLNYIYENDSELEISERTIREIHQLLTSELTEEMLPLKQRGKYKDIPNDVVERNSKTGEEKVCIRTTPPGVQTETAMRELILEYYSATKAQVHLIIRIAMFVVRFLAIHPFRDGNGRLSRLLTCLLVLKEYSWSRYVSHEKFIEDNKEAYYIALRNTQNTFSSENENYDEWIYFFATIVHRQSQWLHQKISELGSDAREKVLNTNEQKVIKFLEKNGQSKSTAINKAVKLSKDGLKKLLKRLVEKEEIEMVGAGPNTEYRLI